MGRASHLRVAATNERFLRPNWQGSIVLVTDSTGQTIDAVNTYDEYGIPGANNTGRFQYTGQAWIPELGMYYYKARMYSPTLGRFMQTDPIGYKDQIDLYAYVGNDPVNKSDPSGNDTLVIYSGPKSSNPFGHVAVAVSGRGVYSYGTADPRGSSTTQYINNAVQDRSVTVVDIPTTTQQENQIVSGWTKVANQTYHWYDNNCATAVANGLDNAGLTPTAPKVGSPDGTPDPIASYAGVLPALTLAQAQEQQGSKTTSIPQGNQAAGQQFRSFDPPPPSPPPPPPPKRDN